MLISFFTFQVFAMEEVNCPDGSGTDSSTQYQRLFLKSKVCSLTFTVRNPVGYPQRQFIITSGGRVSAFVSKSGKGTGQKTYYIVPIEDSFELSRVDSENESYKVNTGEIEWNIKKNNHLELPNKNCSGAEEPVTNANHGGFEISSCKNKIVIDAGWKEEDPPSEANKAGYSTLRDSKNHSCKVPNIDLFDYFNDYAGKLDYFHLRYKSEQGLVDNVLKKHPDCSALINFRDDSVKSEKAPSAGIKTYSDLPKENIKKNDDDEHGRHSSKAPMIPLSYGSSPELNGAAQ